MHVVLNDDTNRYLVYKTGDKQKSLQVLFTGTIRVNSRHIMRLMDEHFKLDGAHGRKSIRLYLDKDDGVKVMLGNEEIVKAYSLYIKDDKGNAIF